MVRVTDPTPTLFVRHGHANWVRLQTLMTLRWIAIAGQILAILVAVRAFDLQLELGLCFAAIGLSVIANLVALFVYPRNKRMTEAEVAGMLLFDIVQLILAAGADGGPAQPVRAADPGARHDLGHGAALADHGAAWRGCDRARHGGHARGTCRCTPTRERCCECRRSS